MNKVAVAYIPVVHSGYVSFLNNLEEEGITKLFLVGDDILAAHEELDYIHRKDRLRAVGVADMLRMLKSLTNLDISVMDISGAAHLNESTDVIVAPREDITEVVVTNYFPSVRIDMRDISVRLDRIGLNGKKIPEAVRSVAASVLQQEIFNQVLTEAGRSFDWWRHVGAALVKDGEVLFVAHNEHMPEEQISNIIGDARALFKKGVHINYVTSAHAEISLIASAAKQGIATQGAELYVTDFPCPYCARAIAKSGIKRVYFLDGYAVLDGDDFLKEEGVEIVHIKK